MRERKRERGVIRVKSAKPSYSVSARAGIGRERKEIKWGLRHVDPLRLVSQHRRPRRTVCCVCRPPGARRGRQLSNAATTSSSVTGTRSAKLWPPSTSSTRSCRPHPQAPTPASSTWTTPRPRTSTAIWWSCPRSRTCSRPGVCFKATRFTENCRQR